MEALKYALEISTAEIGILFSESGSRQHTGRPGRSVAAIEIIERKVSKGGVGAKVASSPDHEFVERLTASECLDSNYRLY